MILDRLLHAARVRSPWSRVIVGASAAALVVSVCTAGALWLLGMGMNAGVAGALGVTAAAAYGVSVHRST